MSYFLLFKFIYLALLVLNLILFSVSVFKYFIKLWPLLIYIVYWVILESVTLLVNYRDLLILGEETNAPFYHFALISDLILFFIFFKSSIRQIKLMKLSSLIFWIALPLTISCYLFFDVNLVEHNAWIPFISKTAIITLCVIYFIALLDSKKGFPYIAIGIFVVSNAAIIDMSTFPFYEGVEWSLWNFRNTIYLITLIMMHLLFMYQLRLLYKNRNKNLTDLTIQTNL